MKPDALLAGVLAAATNPPSDPRCLGHEQPGLPHLLVSVEDRAGDRVVHVSAVVNRTDAAAFIRLLAEAILAGRLVTAFMSHVRQPTLHAEWVEMAPAWEEP